MLINLRNALMTGKRLPYDNEVEYLESTGTQYINTGVLVSSALDDAQIDITYSSSDNTGDLYLFGGGNTYGTAIQMGLTTHTGYVGVSWGQVVSVRGAYQKDAVTIARMTYNDYSISFGSTTKTGSFTATPRTFSERNIYLFRINRSSGGINSNKPVRIYAFKISRNGVAIIDYIPVRKGTTGYLYDRVSGQLFGNAGTGAFGYGNDLPLGTLAN